MKRVAIIALVILSSCSVQKRIEKTLVESINFGTGGGFTGQIVEYNLNKNGVVTLDGKVVKELKLKSTYYYFNKASELISIQHDVPKNMYSFIEIFTSDSKNKIVWGDGTTTVDQKVYDLHKELLLEIAKEKKN